MKLTSYYLHGFANQEGKPYNTESTLESLEEILRSGALLSRRGKGDLDESKGGWNGLDYISICNYRKKDGRTYENNKFYKGYTAYECFIKQSPAFILKKNKIEVIKPTLMPPIIFDWDSHYLMYQLGNTDSSARYSDLPDELQVKDRISLDRSIGLTLPVDYMIQRHEPSEIDLKYETDLKAYDRLPVTLDELYKYVTSLKEMLESYKVASKIYDLESQVELDNNSIEEVYTRVRKLK